MQLPVFSKCESYLLSVCQMHTWCERSNVSTWVLQLVAYQYRPESVSRASWVGLKAISGTPGSGGKGRARNTGDIL